MLKNRLEHGTANKGKSLKNIYTSGLLPWFMFFMGFVAMSPVLNLMGWRGVYYLLIIFTVSSVFLLLGKIKLKKWFLCFIFAVFFTSTITSLYWGDFRYILANIFVVLALFLIQFSTKEAVNKTITIATWFLSIALVGAVIGYILALLDIQPLFEFPNPDGRPNYFFYTTLTNVFWGGWIRPSGIYDEPGALSLYVCALAAMRHLTGRDNKVTWLMLLLGFITFSLAHLIYVFFHLLSERLTKRNVKRFLYFGFLLIVVLFSTGLHQTVENKLLGRLAIDKTTGSFKGDNRTFRMINVIDLMVENPSIVLYGGDPVCRFNYKECQEMFPPIGENPLAPMFTSGLLVSWPYYIALALFLVAPLRGRKYLVFFGCALFIMQRPFVLYISGAFISAMLFYLYVHTNSVTSKANRAV